MNVLSCSTSATADSCSRKPRIVAAKVKPRATSAECDGKLRISGDLKVTEDMCHLRYAEVRNGSLLLYRYTSKDKECVSRIPLYNLNISLDSFKGGHNQFTLSKYGELTPIVTLQVVKEKDYNAWIKALVVEIIRQTPLNTMKFLDVLFTNELLNNLPKAHKTCPAKPIDFIETDLPRSTNRIFKLNEPVREVQFLKPSNTYDSGFYSLQEVSSTHSNEREDVKSTKTKLKCQDSFKVNLSTGCSNLINKFKRFNASKENDPSLSKENRIFADYKISPERVCSPKNRFKISRRIWKGEEEKCSPLRHPVPDVLKDLPSSECTQCVRLQLPEEVLENKSASSLVRLLTKCQIDKEYVPVQEKKILFESLSRFSFSVDNLKKRSPSSSGKDGKLNKFSASLYNLNSSRSSVPVKVMKLYFEDRAGFERGAYTDSEV